MTTTLTPPPNSNLARLVAFLEASGYTRESTPKLDGDVAARQYRLSVGERSFGTVWERHRRTCHWIVELGEGIGYSGFCCRFYFDKDGALLDHGVWE